MSHRAHTDARRSYDDADYSDYYDDDGHRQGGRSRRRSLSGRLLDAIGVRNTSPDPPGYMACPVQRERRARSMTRTVADPHQHQHHRHRHHRPSQHRDSYSGYAAHDRSPDRDREITRDRWGQSLRAAADAAAVEAIRLRHEPGPWTSGHKATRLATTAASAAAIEALLNSRDEGGGASGGDQGGLKRRIGAAVGGLVVNRLVNGSRRNV